MLITDVSKTRLFENERAAYKIILLKAFPTKFKRCSLLH